MVVTALETVAREGRRERLKLKEKENFYDFRRFSSFPIAVD